MARILSDTFTCPGDETPTYSVWATVGTATSLDASVTSMNNESPDLWVQWADDQENPDEPVDVFAGAPDPNQNDGDNYHVVANGLTPAGAYVRIKGIAYGTDAGPCHAIIDTA